MDAVARTDAGGDGLWVGGGLSKKDRRSEGDGGEFTVVHANGTGPPSMLTLGIV